MKFILWQNIISIHQSAFVKALSEKHDVTLVVERQIEAQRTLDGWNVPAMGRAKVIVAPDEATLDRLIGEDEQTVHLLSGIDWVFRKQRLMQRLVAKRCRIVSYMEPYNWRGAKGALRRLKYAWLNLRFGQRVSALLPTGITGCRAYEKAGFPVHKIFEWGYFTEMPEKTVFTDPGGRLPKLLFVGSIDERKNVLSIMDDIVALQDRIDRFSIIGIGPLSEELTRRTRDTSKIEYLGGKSNVEVRSIMSDYDLLILPSLFDGWGAVVNEALQNGMRVICSDCCGAGTLLGERWRGEVFSLQERGGLRRALLSQFELGADTPAARMRIVDWASKTISGAAAADYFEKICQYQFGGASVRPAAPWK